MAESVPEVPCAFPTHTAIIGKHVKLHPMQAEHADQLFDTIAGKGNDTLYTYIPYGPFYTLDSYRERIVTCIANADPQFYSIEDVRTGRLVGQISYLRITPAHRCIEIGHVIFGPTLQRSIGATEAFYLLARKAFDEGYRRLEWKCDNTNAASRRAAIRFGHTFEGIFRQHMVIKGRNRDSAWFSILDREWPGCRDALTSWMREDNFDENGRQKKTLATFQTEFERKK